MTELPFERAAMRGEPMSDSLDFIDAVMYQGLAALYFRFFQKAITKEQGQIEKKHLMRKYTVERNLKSYEDIMYRWNSDLRKAVEAAQNAYRKNRTLENADRLSAALDGRLP